MRISKKIALVYLITLLPLLALGLSLLFAWYQSQMALIDQERLNNAKLVATSFSTTVQDAATASRALGLATIASPPVERTPLRLSELASGFPLHWSAVLDTSGKVIYSSDRQLLDRVIVDAATERVSRGEATAIGNSRMIGKKVGFLVAASITNEDGKLLGIGASFVDPRRLAERLAANRIIGGGANVVDSSGHLVVLFEEPRMGLLRPYWAHFPFIRAALEGRQAVDRNFVFPGSNDRRVIAAVPIEPFGWEAGSSVRLSEALRPFLGTLVISVIIAGAVFLASALIARSLSRSMVKSVEGLERQAEWVGQADAQPMPVISSGDEIEHVSRVLRQADEELKSYIGGLEGIADAGQILASALTPEDVQDAVVRAAKKLFDARAIWVFCYDVESDSLQTSIWYSDTGAGPPVNSVKPGESIAGRVFQSNRLELIPDVRAEADFAWPEIADQHEIRSLVELPLVRGGSPIGVLAMFAPGVERWGLRGRETELLRAFGSQVATLLENARLYERQRSVADTLQQALLTLPDSIEGLEFAHTYHSASQSARVGGDFYDLFDLDEQTIGVVMGDIAGKGLEAAVLTSLVKNTVRAHANELGKGPAEVVELTNNLLAKTSGPEAFVTLFVAYLDPSTGNLTYCNAGHTTAAVIEIGVDPLALPSNSPLVGAFTEFRFAQECIRLASGQTLFLYTDGLTEARGEAGLYGETRLFELLADLPNDTPQAIVDAVFKAAVEFTGGTLSDDLAMLALRRTC